MHGSADRQPRQRGRVFALRPNLKGASLYSGAVLAEISDFSIVTYERKPGRWRAAFTRQVRSDFKAGGIRSVVTPDDYPTEQEAEFAAQKLIRKL
jgi:hypothetical protein